MTDPLIDQIAAQVIARIPQALPVEMQLWNHADIANYLRAKVRTIAEKTVMRPDFPKPVRPPLMRDTEQGYPLYRAAEVIRWAEATAGERKRMAA